MPKKRKKPSERSYARLTRSERNDIERMLDQSKSCREIAAEIGRSPSTVKREVDRHRFITSPRSRRGEPAPDELGKACPRLGSWPRCCNGCKKKRAYGCSRKPQVFYDARWAQQAADEELSAARRGIDESEQSAAIKLQAIRDGLARGLSPEQIAASRPELALSASTIYRWVDAGYDRLTNMDLRRKVGYKQRKKGAREKRTSHSQRRLHAAFLALGEDACASAWEMDTVEGCARDSARLLTLLHRPTRLQLALIIPDGSCASVLAGLGLVRDAMGGEGMRRTFSLVLTDNGSEFSDEDAIATVLGEQEGETRLFYCDSRRADQKGACEKNHVEIRKILPKRSSLRFDFLTRADCALVMSHVNSEPRGCLGFRTPYDAFADVFGDEGSALLDALGVERLPASKLDLTPHLIERARAERGDRPLV